MEQQKGTDTEQKSPLQILCEALMRVESKLDELIEANNLTVNAVASAAENLRAQSEWLAAIAKRAGAGGRTKGAPN